MSKSTVRKVMLIYILWLFSGFALVIIEGVCQTFLGNSLFLGVILPLSCFVLGLFSYYDLIMPKVRSN